ncbi:hypothetical protein ACFE04_017485 [Oxalis oulophora]
MDKATAPQKPYYYSSPSSSINRQKLPLYGHPIPTRHHPIYADGFDDDDEDDQNDIAFNAYNLGTPDTTNTTINNFDRHSKKRKLKTAPLGYDYGVDGGGNWTDHEKFMLLEVWGDKFLQLGRKSLRNEDWVDVAERVGDALKIVISDTQCRQILDELKRKYNKEKAKVEALGFSKWPFFKKMDMLMIKQECGLACGLDSGEFVFMDTQVYLNKSNGLDEMRDSPCESEIDGEEDGEEEDEQELFEKEEVKKDDESIRMLADTVQRFGRIYEKIETSKSEQMRELERLRADFSRDLEIQKKQIMEKAQAEIDKIREEEESEDDSDDSSAGDSMENGNENHTE